MYSVRRHSVPSRLDPAAAEPSAVAAAVAGVTAAVDAAGDAAPPVVEEHATRAKAAVSATAGPIAPPRRRVDTLCIPLRKGHPARPITERHGVTFSIVLGATEPRRRVPAGALTIPRPAAAPASHYAADEGNLALVCTFW